MFCQSLAKMLRHWVASVMLLVALFVSPSYAQSAKQAAVAMPDAYSAEVAKQVLMAGGNAVDAAVAAGFTLAVTFPEAGNLGGGGFMTLYVNGQAKFLDYREVAPLSAHPKLYLDANEQVIPYRSLVGYQASGVPGTVMGLWQAHQAHGRLAWDKLLAPAIALAKDGFVVPEQMVQTAQWFQQWIADKSPVALNFADHFGQLKTGALFKQPELAQTLARIARAGAADFYHGKTAQLLVKQMQAHGGLITAQDLANYRAVWRAPIQFEWQGKTVVSAPPPSSGGVALAQLLGMQALTESAYTKANSTLPVAEQQALKIHWMAELSKRVYADRATYLGDPDFYKVPVADLLAASYLQKRASDISMTSVTPTQSIQPGLAESPETTHYSIVDFEGNAVANTTTLNMPFGSGVVIAGAGFLMNDEMDDFATKPGVANAFGVLGGKANEVVAGKRMLSSMSPTLVLKQGQVDMVVGSPGGSSIITSVFQTILNHYQFGLSAQASVDAPRFHHQLWPENRVDYSPDIAPEVAKRLQTMGYHLRANHYLGDVQLVVRGADKQWQAASDKRGRGQSWVFSAALPSRAQSSLH